MTDEQQLARLSAVLPYIFAVGDMLCAHARQIRTGKWLSTMCTYTVTVVYFSYNPCMHMDVIYRMHAP